MGRSYKAARRSALKVPVDFEVSYEKPVVHRDEESGQVTGTSFEEVTDTFVARGNISTLMLSELAAQSDLDNQSPEGAALIRNVFAQAFNDEAEYQRFFRVATRYLEDDEIFDIMGDLVEDLAGRPTVQPSLSPETPSTTTDSGPTSRAGQPATPETPPALAPADPAIAVTHAAQAAPVARRVSLDGGTVEVLAEPTAEQLAALEEVEQLEAMMAAQAAQERAQQV